MPRDRHIFLSYRSLEADFALKLAADLKNAGFNLWMDRLDGIQSGDDWRRSIEQALTEDTCAAVVAALSPDYVQSEYCRNELARANRLAIPIYPVLLRPVPDADWPLEIERIQFVNFQQWLDEPIYREKLQNLLAVLSAQYPEQKGVVPDAETRYLTTLIAELEAKRGVLQYVELAVEADSLQPVRPRPRPEDEWGFSLLVQDRQAADTPGEPVSIPFATIVDAVRNHARLVLIGEPGAGKTTTLRRLARDAARARLDNPRTAPLPLLLYLPEWADESSPADFVRARWPFESDAIRLLHADGGLLFLDGLNEMGAAGAQRAAQLYDWLQAPDAPARVIVTCRQADYGGSLKLGNIPTVLVQPLTHDQIRSFAARYLGTRADAFLGQLPLDDHFTAHGNRSLFQLAQNPYMLSALLYLYDHSPSGDLPHLTGSLFQKLAQALWERERQRDTPGWMLFEQAETAFGQLAFSMIVRDTSIDVPISLALEYLGNKNLLRVGASASYLTLHGEQVRFYHQLLQEYFAAVVVERLARDGRLRDDIRLVSSDLQVFYARWNYVLIAAMGLALNPDDFLIQITEVDPWLLLQWEETGIQISETVHSRIVSRMVAMLTSDEGLLSWVEAPWNRQAEEDTVLMHGLRRERAARFLGELRDPTAVPALLEALQTTPSQSSNPLVRIFGPDVRVQVIQALTAIEDTSVVPQLAAALYDTDRTYYGDTRVCDAAADALAHFGTPEACAAVERWRNEESGRR